MQRGDLQRLTEADRDSQRNAGSCIEMHRQLGRKRDRQIQRERQGQTETYRGRQRVRQRQTDRQTETDRETDRDRQRQTETAIAQTKHTCTAAFFLPA